MQLLKILDRVPEGIPFDDLVDCYKDVKQDLDELTRTGQCICVRNIELGKETYTARGFTFLTELASKVVVRPNGTVCRTSEDFVPEIRRGDSIQVNEHWFRVANTLRVRS